MQMNSLEQLTNVERAKLLFDLFKDKIPGFLKFTKNTVVVLLEREAEHRLSWENKLFTFDFWLSLATCIEEKISRFGKSMERSGFIFSEQLFDGYHALFMTHCLEQYCKVNSPKNEKFVKAVELLFE